MRRLPRIVLNAATVVSLALCVATVVLWLRGFTDLTESPDGLSNSFTARGTIYLKHRTARGVYMADAVSLRGWRLLGFGSETGTRADGQSETWRELHVWPLTVTSAVLPLFWLVRWGSARRRAGRVMRNRCAACGYDLRATPDRCPECGTIPTR